MPSRKFKLTVSGHERDLLLSWRGFWKDIKITLGGDFIGGFENQIELKEGKKFKLSDGSDLSVKLVRKGFLSEIQIFKDDSPVSGSDSHPETRLKSAYIIIAFLAALNLLMAAAATKGGTPQLKSMGFGAYNLVVGLLYASCVAFGWRGKFLIPLVLALAIFLGDTAMAFRQNMALAPNIPPSWIIVRIILGTPIVLGAVAAWSRMRAVEETERRK